MIHFLNAQRPNFKNLFEPRLNYGWFHLKLCSMFQDLSRHSIKTGFWRIWDATKINKFGLRQDVFFLTNNKLILINKNLRVQLICLKGLSRKNERGYWRKPKHFRDWPRPIRVLSHVPVSRNLITKLAPIIGESIATKLFIKIVVHEKILL